MNRLLHPILGCAVVQFQAGVVDAVTNDWPAVIFSVATISSSNLGRTCGRGRVTSTPSIFCGVSFLTAGLSLAFVGAWPCSLFVEVAGGVSGEGFGTGDVTGSARLTCAVAQTAANDHDKASATETASLFWIGIGDKN